MPASSMVRVVRSGTVSSEPLWFFGPCEDPSAGLDFARLEKRSQALQACNLTRNIQVDGAPMVQASEGSAFRGFFLRHRTPEPCLGKRTWIASQPSDFSRGSCLGSRAVAFSCGRQAIKMSPMHLSGTLVGAEV